eukprot:2378845-Karenia_brevis.AAC.1
MPSATLGLGDTNCSGIKESFIVQHVGPGPKAEGSPSCLWSPAKEKTTMGTTILRAIARDEPLALM